MRISCRIIRGFRAVFNSGDQAVLEFGELAFDQ